MANNENETVGNNLAEPMFDKLKRTLKKIEIDGELFYIAEGDLLIDEQQLPQYSLKRAASPPVNEADFRSQLIVVAENGKMVRWKPDTILSYCILKNTFGSQEKYELVREKMTRATWDWEAVCGVKFTHKIELDDSPTNNPADVLFTVREIDASGRFIAAAFFPNEPRNRRRLVIDPSYYTTSFDKVGVLRHELGHVLGFRHEQIRSGAPPVCQGEEVGEVIELTAYDPKSVMHYFCGGVGSLNLEITEIDKSGAQKLYGASFDAVTFYD